MRSSLRWVWAVSMLALGKGKAAGLSRCSESKVGWTSEHRIMHLCHVLRKLSIQKKSESAKHNLFIKEAGGR